MKQARFLARSITLALALLTGIGAAGGMRAANAQGASSLNMKLVGTNDLQARSTYQPTLHKYPHNRYILFAGHHPLATQGEGHLPNAQLLPSFNLLTGKNELNGTSIVDVTRPGNPQYLFHLPVPDGGAGGAQMVRVCDGNTLPVHDGKIYMLRTYANSAHEIWDVTNPSNPIGVRTVAGGNPVIGAQTGAPGVLAGTHKSWWECDTGIAYIVGRRGNDTADGWGLGNHIFIFDLSDPANPVYLRDWALDGQQPGGAIPPHFTTVPSIHGPISTGPAGGAVELAGATAERVYFAYGTGSNGDMQIVDRTKLLPPPFGSGVTCGSISSTLASPACTDFHTAVLGDLIMNPDNGAHTSFPLGRLVVPDFVTDTSNDEINNVDNSVRDIVVITSEATAHFCSEFRHLTWDGRSRLPLRRCLHPKAAFATSAAASGRMRPTRSLGRRSTRKSCSSRTSTPACAPSMSAIRTTPKTWRFISPLLRKTPTIGAAHTRAIQMSAGG